MSNRIVSCALFLLVLGVSFAQQGSDPSLNRGKQVIEEIRTMTSGGATKLPTPTKDEAVISFQNGDYVVITIGHRVSIPDGEKFRGVYGEGVQFNFVEKGQMSGNSVWAVSRR
jgi:hypothetical protein